MLSKKSMFGAITVALMFPLAASAQLDLEALPDAKPGECFAKVLVPAEYRDVEKTVVTQEASNRIEVVAPKYELVEERVVTRPAYQKVVPVAAKMKTVTETVTIEPSRLVWKTGTGSKAAIAKELIVATAAASGLPETAKDGQCFAQFFQAAQYEDRPSEIIVREAAKKFETAAAKYEWVEERVVTREASSKKVEVPAEYETITEKVLVKPAYVTWKKGRGLIERVDNGTGDIMCRVEIPAEYKEVKRRVVKTPARTETVEIPAQYETVRVQKLVAAPTETAVAIDAEKATYTTRIKKSEAITGWRPVGTDGPGELTGAKLCRAELPARTKEIKRQVVATPAAVNKIDVPAETRVVKVRKLVAPATEKKIEIPQKTEVVQQREKVSDERLAWRSVLCETNATPGLVTNIQRALQAAGYEPGPIDGVIGRSTLSALDQYQVKKGLARGGLTKSTLDSLGIQLQRR